MTLDFSLWNCEQHFLFNPPRSWDRSEQPQWTKTEPEDTHTPQREKLGCVCEYSSVTGRDRYMLHDTTSAREQLLSGIAGTLSPRNAVNDTADNGCGLWRPNASPREITQSLPGPPHLPPEEYSTYSSPAVVITICTSGPFTWLPNRKDLGAPPSLSHCTGDMEARGLVLGHTA